MPESMQEPGMPPKIAPEYKSMEHFKAEINDTGYARYNYQELLKREAQLTKMIEGATDVALFNSGAAAMHSALEAEGLKAGDVVFCANAIYGTTKADIQQLEDLGIKVVIFDSTDLGKLQELVQKEKPRLIVAETIANSKNMEVTDLKRLGEMTAQTNKEYQDRFTPEKILTSLLSKKEWLKELNQETIDLILSSVQEYQTGQNPLVFRQVVREIEHQTPYNRKEAIRELSKVVKFVMKESREKLSLIIDNTLPSPQLINPLIVLRDNNVELTVVESGTKHYQEGANEITMGLVYSADKKRMENIKARRIELGTYLQPSDERKIPDTISETMPQIMRNHARNALQLAQAIGKLPGFEVFHPNLPQHKQSEFVTELAPEGAVTLFYITVPERMTGEQFMQKIKDLAGEGVGLGSSFGHSKTWLSNYGQDNRTVRIAAGSESEAEFQKTIEIFQKIDTTDI